MIYTSTILGLLFIITGLLMQVVGMNDSN